MSQRRSILDPATLRRLLQRLEATDIDELEVEVGNARIYLRRELGKQAALPERKRSRPGGVPAGIPIVAPLTGVYYSRPAPEQSPFVEVGTPVSPGDVVALIETMKLFNEVTSEVAGEVVEIRAGDGDLVEAGQPLIYVRPRGEGEQP